MSLVHPPGRLLGLGVRPFGANTPGCGHVRASFGMNASIENGAFGKWLLNAVPVLVSVQSAGCGGDVRLTSFCSRQLYRSPFWPIWFVRAASAFARPFTPSQPPYRLSKLWFSS